MMCLIATLVNTSFRSVLLLNSSASYSIADGCTSRALAEQEWYRCCSIATRLSELATSLTIPCWPRQSNGCRFQKIGFRIKSGVQVKV
jgi:hypothetical protein